MQVRAQACLSPDDLDGLNYLYPTCGDYTRQQPPSCVKSRRNSGWLRLALVCGLPTALALLVVMLLVYYSKHREHRRFSQLARDLHVLRQARAS